MKQKHVRTIHGLGDDGRRYEINEYATFIPLATLDDPHGEKEGLHGFRTPDGGAVNRISDDEYEIVGTGVRVRVG